MPPNWLQHPLLLCGLVFRCMKIFISVLYFFRHALIHAFAKWTQNVMGSKRQQQVKACSLKVDAHVALEKRTKKEEMVTPECQNLLAVLGRLLKLWVSSHRLKGQANSIITARDQHSTRQFHPWGQLKQQQQQQRIEIGLWISAKVGTDVVVGSLLLLCA